jgi:hypothetical protein
MDVDTLLEALLVKCADLPADIATAADTTNVSPTEEHTSELQSL